MKVGDWVSVPYGGASTDDVWLAVSEEEPSEEEWFPAFYEAGSVFIRVPPHLEPGDYFLWRKTKTGAPERAHVVRVE